MNKETLKQQLLKGTLDFDSWLIENKKLFHKYAYEFGEEYKPDENDDDDDISLQCAVYIASEFLEDDDEEITQDDSFLNFVTCLQVALTLEKLTKKGLLKKSLKDGVDVYSLVT